MAFSTPHEDFYAFLEMQDKDYRYNQYLEIEMCKHEAEAIAAISRDMKEKFLGSSFAYCVASAFIEGVKDAECIFDRHRLSEIHAWALQGNLKNFTVEFEKIHETEQDYED